MNVLFLDKVHPILAEMLTKAGHRCNWNTEGNLEDITSELASTNGIVLRSRFTIDEKFLGLAPQLQFIARSGSGLENIDLAVAKSKGIKVINSPEGNSAAVAEHACGMLLSLFNNLCRSDHQIRKGLWIREGNRGIEIGGKTLGIIGFGNTGSAFARVMSGFGCRILAYDRYKSSFAPGYVQESKIEDLFRECDIVSFHVPLTDETKYMAGLDFFMSFHRNIYVINTSRGSILNTAELVAAMKGGKVLGACLDVLEYEDFSFESIHTARLLPDPLRWLYGSDKAILTPHIAGWTKESYYKLSRVLADKILSEFPT